MKAPIAALTALGILIFFMSINFLFSGTIIITVETKYGPIRIHELEAIIKGLVGIIGAGPIIYGIPAYNYKHFDN